MSEPKVIARIRGGLGNQLFCYAAARRLAMKNGVPLVIDNKTGFIRDHKYRRTYALDRFSIPCRIATPRERMEPLERYRRGLAKYVARRRRFEKRTYLEQEGPGFDARLLGFNVSRSTYLDGYWQSERYFEDVASTIRQDLRMRPPGDAANAEMAARIRGSESVAMHLRFFETSAPVADPYAALARYYSAAMTEMEKNVTSPTYFVFSDRSDLARDVLRPHGLDNVTFVSHNDNRDGAWADFWLMSQCEHSIIASSTFSWWAAWLSEELRKNTVIAPSETLVPGVAWGFEGLFPERWHKLAVG